MASGDAPTVLTRIASAKATGGAAAFSAVAQLLKAHADDVDIVVEAISALSFIALHCTDVRDTRTGLKAVDPITDSLLSHATHVRAVVAACRALVVISTNSFYKQAFIVAGAFRHLVAALPTHVADASAVIAVCGALSRLVEEPQIAHKLVEVRMPEQLITALETHAALPAVIKAVFGFMSAIGVRLHPLFSLNSVIPHVVDALKAHSKHTGAVTAACSCLSYFFLEGTDDPVVENSLSLVSAGGLEPLLAVLQTNAGACVVRDTCMVLE